MTFQALTLQREEETLLGGWSQEGMGRSEPRERGKAWEMLCQEGPGRHGKGRFWILQRETEPELWLCGSCRGSTRETQEKKDLPESLSAPSKPRPDGAHLGRV